MSIPVELCMSPDHGPGEIQRFEVRVGIDQRPSEFAMFDCRLGEDDAVRYRGVLDRCAFEYIFLKGVPAVVVRCV